MTVHSPKTEHHDGKESRVVPIFAELRPYLEAARAEAKDAEYVITIQAIDQFRRGIGKSPNLGTRMKKIIRRAGLKQWPKLFHNLRASRQTELAQRFPEHVVCEWIGNSQAVAREHYLRVTDTDYDKAAGATVLRAAKSAARGAHKAQHKAQQHTAVPSVTLLEIVKKALETEGLGQVTATLCKAVQECSLTPRGIEPLLPP